MKNVKTLVQNITDNLNIGTVNIIECRKRSSSEKNRGMFTTYFKKPIVSDKVVFAVLNSNQVESIGISILNGRASLTYQNKTKGIYFRSVSLENGIFKSHLNATLNKKSSISIEMLIDAFDPKKISLDSDIEYTQQLKEEFEIGQRIEHDTNRLIKKTCEEAIKKTELACSKLVKVKEKVQLKNVAIQETEEYKEVRELEAKLEMAQARLRSKEAELNKAAATKVSVEEDYNVYSARKEIQASLTEILKDLKTVSENNDLDIIKAKHEALNAFKEIYDKISASEFQIYPEKWDISYIVTTTKVYNIVSPIELMLWTDKNYI